MKAYGFAPIAAREYPSIKVLDHPYIWGGVQFCINVSEKSYSTELVDAMRGHGIEWMFLPVSEELGADWISALETALPIMYEMYKAGKKQVVHCDFGNNRSRTFVEVFYYLLKGEQFQDEYKGEINHLIYNCKRGHLPPIEEIKGWILSIGLSILEQTGDAPEWIKEEEEEQRLFALVREHVQNSIRVFRCGTPRVRHMNQMKMEDAASIENLGQPNEGTDAVDPTLPSWRND